MSRASTQIALLFIVLAFPASHVFAQEHGRSGKHARIARKAPVAPPGVQRGEVVALTRPAIEVAPVTALPLSPARQRARERAAAREARRERTRLENEAAQRQGSIALGAGVGFAVGFVPTVVLGLLTDASQSVGNAFACGLLLANSCPASDSVMPTMLLVGTGIGLLGALIGGLAGAHASDNAERPRARPMAGVSPDLRGGMLGVEGAF